MLCDARPVSELREFNIARVSLSVMTWPVMLEPRLHVVGLHLLDALRF